MTSIRFEDGGNSLPPGGGRFAKDSDRAKIRGLTALKVFDFKLSGSRLALEN